MITALAVWIGLTIGNIVYQLFTNGEISKALEISFFQLGACLLTAFLLSLK